MVDTDIFVLLTFMTIGTQIHVVDKWFSDDIDSLKQQAKDRFENNNSFNFAIMEYKLSNASMVEVP